MKRIQQKLMSSLNAAAAIFACALVFTLVFQITQFLLITGDQKGQKIKILEDVMENKSNAIISYVRDYTVWDEMISFIDNPGYKWARENIDASLTDDVSVIWAYTKSFGLIYTVNNINSDYLEEVPADKAILKKLISEKKIVRFFARTKDGVFEIQGASIHPSNDTQRKSNPYGYVFAGKFLGSAYLSSISQVVGSVLTLSTDDSPGFAKKLGQLKNLFVISKVLEGPNGNKIAVLNARVLSPALKRIFTNLIVLSVLFLIILIGVFIKLATSANSAVIRPLQNILGSLNKHSIEQVQFLQNEDTEFGEIAKLVIQHLTRPTEELTELERVQRILRENEERLKFFAGVFPGFIVKDRSSKIIHISGDFAASFNSTADKFIGKSDTDLWPEQAAKKSLELDSAAMGLPKGEYARSEEELEFEGQKRNFIIYRFVIPRLNADSLLGIVAIDITDRSKEEEKKNSLAGIAEKIPLPVLVTNKEGVIEYVNEAFSKHTGYMLDEIKGQNPRVIQSGDTAEEDYKHMWDTISGGNEWRGMLKNKKKDGRFYWTIVNISPVRNPAGEINAYVSVEQDVTELKAEREEDLKAREKAEVSTKAKNEFLASLSHEIRTPLNSLVGVTDLLLDTRLTGEQKEYVSIFKRAADTLLTIVNDILDITKMESGEVQLDYVDFDVKDIVEKAVDVYSSKAQKKGVELKYLIAPDVVRSVVGDQNRLRQILVNLLGNAMKFTEQGEISVEVKNYKLQERDALILFCVADTGVGIPKDRLSAVFESFAITDASTTRKYGGSGLGLAIAKKLVELMGGSIWVESVFGQGSKFFFTVKLKYPDESIKSPIAPKNLKGVKILVADEDDINRTKIRKTLESGGAIIGESEDLQSTFVELAKGASSTVPYSVIIVDSKLKDGGGFSFVETLRGNDTFAGLKIIMMLSERNQDVLNRVRLMDLKHVFKPVKAQPLVLSIENALGIAPQEEEKKTLSSSAQPKKQLKILLADDSEDSRILFKRFLAGTLHILDLADNGTIALNKFMEIDYDLIFLDMHMPIMDGFATIKAMRKYETEQSKEHTPVLALTADAFREDSIKVVEAGCDGHVVKPLKKSTLFEIIDKYSYSPR